VAAWRLLLFNRRPDEDGEERTMRYYVIKRGSSYLVRAGIKPELDQFSRIINKAHLYTSEEKAEEVAIPGKEKVMVVDVVVTLVK
jgi:hypothetical protein